MYRIVSCAVNWKDVGGKGRPAVGRRPHSEAYYQTRRLGMKNGRENPEMI
jgi:hypothetical protein